MPLHASCTMLYLRLSAHVNGKDFLCRFLVTCSHKLGQFFADFLINSLKLNLTILSIGESKPSINQQSIPRIIFLHGHQQSYSLKYLS